MRGNIIWLLREEINMWTEQREKATNVFFKRDFNLGKIKAEKQLDLQLYKNAIR